MESQEKRAKDKKGDACTDDEEGKLCIHKEEKKPGQKAELGNKTKHKDHLGYKLRVNMSRTLPCMRREEKGT